MKLHSSVSVANYIIEKSRKNGKYLTPMQVIKLVYLCHGWMLGLYNKPLISEPIEAWKYGPVIKKLYQKVKQYRSDPINEKLDNSQDEFTSEEQDVMDQVIDKYSDFSGVALSRITHEPGTPWSNTRTLNNINDNTVISNDLIEDHFKQLYYSNSKAVNSN